MRALLTGAVTSHALRQCSSIATSPAAPSRATTSSGGASPQRLARWLARSAACASRRAAESVISAGRVSVNGVTISSVAHDVHPDSDKIALDGALIRAPRPVELYLAHKLPGELVSLSDPEGRPLFFDRLRAMGIPAGVKAVGRLDYASEGLLLLTNDGGVSRFLESPSSGVSRFYRLRVYGSPDSLARTVAAFRRGATVDGVAYRPADVRVLSTEEATKRFGSDAGGSSGGMTAPKSGQASSSSSSGASTESVFPEGSASSSGGPGRDRPAGGPRQNAWLQITLYEGKNREIRRVCEAHGLSVTRLVRVGFGPYSLSGLGRGDVLQIAHVPRWIREMRPQRVRHSFDRSSSSSSSSSTYNDRPERDPLLHRVDSLKDSGIIGSGSRTREEGGFQSSYRSRSVSRTDREDALTRPDRSQHRSFDNGMPSGRRKKSDYSKSTAGDGSAAAAHRESYPSPPLLRGLKTSWEVAEPRT